MEPYIGCAFVKPTKKAEEDGEVPKVIVDLMMVLADSKESAIRKIAKKIPDEYENQDERVEVRCVPFRG